MCFMHYLRVAIIFFRAGLCKSYFIPTLLVKLGFCFSIFWFYVFLSLWFLALSFSVLCFEFNVISKAWILAPDIGQFPAKNRVMFDEKYFATDVVVWRKVKKKYITDILKLRSLILSTNSSSTQTLDVLIFFKIVLPDAQSEIHLVRRNTDSTGPSAWFLKKKKTGLLKRFSNICIIREYSQSCVL